MSFVSGSNIFHSTKVLHLILILYPLERAFRGFHYKYMSLSDLESVRQRISAMGTVTCEGVFLRIIINPTAAEMFMT